MNGFTTLAGISFAGLPAILDRELPADAYSPVPGGVDLTDIDPGYMRKVLNETFGMCGLGWGYGYNANDLAFHSEVREGKYGDRTVIVATLSHLEFWYVAVALEGSQQRCTVHASGSSENSNHAYAMKGAITSALGNAASNIGFQESVYLGHRSHKTVGKGKAPTLAASASKPAAAPAAKAEDPLKAPIAPAPAKPSGNGNGHKPAVAATSAPAATAVVEIEDLDEPGDEPAADLGAYVIPLGKNAGKKLSEVSKAWVEWAANEMQAATDQAKTLQAAAKTYLATLK